jgi:CSLREA domain-containing protein
MPHILLAVSSQRLLYLLWPGCLAGGAFGLLFMLLGGMPLREVWAAPSATITVNSTADNLTGGNGLCTLREAVRNANANNNTGYGECVAGSGADTITLPAGVYTLTLPTVGDNNNQGGDLDATDPTGLTIIGAGLTQTILTISVGDRLIDAVDGPLTLMNLTLQNGSVTGMGGAVQASESLVLSNTQVQSNTASSHGGGVYVQGSIAISGSVFFNNASNGGRGGGLHAIGYPTQTARLTNTSFINNRANSLGGGAYLDLPGQIVGSRFERNQANGTNSDGGGLLGYYSQAITNTQFLSNTAGRGGGGLYLGIGSAVTLTNVGFTNNVALAGYGGGARVATVTVTGGQFTRNQAPEPQAAGGGLGGGLYAGAGVFSLSGTTFLSNTAGRGGGGLYIYTKTLTLQNARFISNSAGAGGGFYAEQPLTAQSSQFLSNVAQQGGGLYAETTITLTQVGLTNNVVISYGGGGVWAGGLLIVNNSWVERNRASHPANGQGAGLIAPLARVTGTTFLSNTAGSYGGGAAVGGISYFTNNTFISNTAGTHGGGLYLDYNDIGHLLNSTFQSNSAGQNGGGVYLGEGSVAGAVLRRNQASEQGGGLYVYSATVVQGSLFEQNRANFDGGGLFAVNGLTVSATRFLSNSTLSNGGGLRAFNNSSPTGHIYIVNVLLVGNAANGQGSALAASANFGAMTILHTTIASPTIDVGPAVMVGYGTAYISNTIVASHTAGLLNQSGSVRENHNLFNAVATPYNGTIIHGGQSLTGPVAFVNHAQYQLGFSSAALNAGANWGVTTDYFGNPRPLGPAPDIGYHEAAYTIYRLWGAFIWR